MSHYPILQNNQPGHFSIHLVAAAVSARYAVQRDGNGHWIVTEAGRQPYRPAGVASALSVQQAWARVPIRSLKAMGHTILPAASPVQSVSHIQEFVVAGRNQLAFIRSLPNHPDALVVVDAAGQVRRQMDLSAIPRVKDTTWTGLAWLGGARYVIGRSVWNRKTAAWIVNLGAHSITPVTGVKCSEIKRLAAFSDGGFVLLGTVDQKYSGYEVVEAFTPRGQHLWTLNSDTDIKPQNLFSPEDIAITTNNQVAVVDVIQDTIQVFDRLGRYQRTISLERSWHRQPSYPSGIAADLRGGFVVNDFDGHPPIMRMTTSGALQSQFQPRYRDGRTFYIRGRVQVAPNGSLWTSDGYAILRLKENGVVDRVLGPAPNPARLGAIGELFIDRTGHIYALDERTNAVHKFNRQGRHLASFKPLPTDFDENDFGARFSVSQDGEVFLEGAVQNGTVHFSRQGTRLGIQRSVSRHDKPPSKPGSLARPARHGNTTSHPHDLHWFSNTLLDKSGVVIRKMERRANGTWMESVQDTSSAPDYAVAILDAVSGITEHRPQFISLYAPSGASLRTIPIPGWMGEVRSLAYDGRQIIIVGDKRVTTMNSAGQVLWQFTPRAMHTGDAWWSVFILNRGRTLALFDGHHTINYYGL